MPDGTHPTTPPKENVMKRLALIALVLSAAACTKKEEPATDTAAAVPAATATAPGMDTGMVHDSTKADSIAKADSAKADTTKKK
jgi:hypothetical protein